MLARGMSFETLSKFVGDWDLHWRFQLKNGLFEGIEKNEKLDKGKF